MTQDPVSFPQTWRIVAAFVLTPYVVAFGVVSVGEFFFGSGLFDLIKVARMALLGALFLGYPIMIVLGLPLFFALRMRVRPSAFNCALAGAFSIGLAAFYIAIHAGSGPDPAAPATILGSGAVVVVLGAVAGVVFWLIAAAGMRTPG